MNYPELENMLDSLLKTEGLSSTIEYRGDHINYGRRRRLWLLLKAVYRLLNAQLFYMSYIRGKIHRLKKTGSVYSDLKKTRCLKQLRTYLYLSKIGLTDLATQIGGRFDDKLFANFAIATMLYDASFDIPSCRKYLNSFDAAIMEKKQVNTNDVYLAVFQECVDYLNHALGKQAFEQFMNLVKIEHISQLMSIYQLSDKATSKEDLFKITFAKGGISALALLHLMTPKMKEQEKKAIYDLGAVMQLIDDISDIKEDLKIGIQTLPNQKLLTYEELKQLYFGTINNLIDQCNMDPHRPNGTLDMLCWFADIILEKRYKPFLQAP